jgi:hypothetical protein
MAHAGDLTTDEERNASRRRLDAARALPDPDLIIVGREPRRGPSAGMRKMNAASRRSQFPLMRVRFVPFFEINLGV